MIRPFFNHVRPGRCAVWAAAGLLATFGPWTRPPPGDPVVFVVDQADGRWIEVELTARAGRTLPPGPTRALRRPRWVRLNEGDRAYAILDESKSEGRLRRAQRLPPTP